MKTSDSIAEATVSLFEAGDCPFLVNRSMARQIFVSDRKNRLNVAKAMPCTIFYFHPSKICLAQNGHNL